MKKFVLRTDGAATVDWIVLTAAVVGGGVAALAKMIERVLVTQKKNRSRVLVWRKTGHSSMDAACSFSTEQTFPDPAISPGPFFNTQIYAKAACP